MFSFSNLIALGCIQGIIVSIYLLKQGMASRLLAILLSLISINICINFYIDGGLFTPSMSVVIWWSSINTYLLYGPLILAYIYTLLWPEREFELCDSVHFFPFVSYVLGVFVCHSIEVETFHILQSGALLQIAKNTVLERFTLMPIVTAFHFGGYLFYGTYITVNVFLTRKTLLSKNKKLWLISVLVISHCMMLSILVASIIAIALDIEKSPEFLAYSNLTTIIGFLGLTFLLFQTGSPPSEQSNVIKKLIKSTKPEHFVELLSKLDEIMLRDKVFLDPELNQLKLSEYLGVSRHKLSEVLSVHPAGSFNNLINNHRIKAVLEKLEMSQSNTKLINIAYECGFNSKSTFNSVFKRHTNNTPSEYRKLIMPNTDKKVK